MERRCDLDWLRVGAFLLLILYHLGMFYVPWGWHAKSPHAPVAGLELPMKLLNPWRLPLLFFISGVVLRYALDRSNPRALLQRRLWVLAIPLLFGMLVICAPQAWNELVQSGQFDGSVWQFYLGYLSFPWASPEGWSIITPTWNHLWYVLYVLVFSFVLICLSSIIRSVTKSRHVTQQLWLFWLFAAPVIQLVFLALLWSSVGASQTLWGDWYNLTVSGLIMTFGFMAAKNPAFWALLRKIKRIMLALVILNIGVVTVLYLNDSPRHLTYLARVLFGWTVIYALLGWSQTLLTRRTALLSYLSQAVFTYYILHQTIIIMAGVPLSALGLPLIVEVSALAVITAVGCWAGYEFLAKRMGQWGILLGARNPPTSS